MSGCSDCAMSTSGRCWRHGITGVSTNTQSAMHFDHLTGRSWFGPTQTSFAPPEPDPPGPLTRVQMWLQGWPDKRRPWAVAWLGNRVSDIRYWLWRFTR